MRSGSLGALALCVPFLCTSCKLFAPAAPGQPGWIYTLPQEQSYLYATGQYHGSLNPNDNFKNAISASLGSLAQALWSNVKVDAVVQYSNADFTVRSKTESQTSAKVVNATLVHQWVDRDGRVSIPGTVWVLMRCPRVNVIPAGSQ